MKHSNFVNLFCWETGVLNFQGCKQKVLKFNELKEETKKVIDKVSKENYKNYFNYAYKKDDLRKYKKGISTSRRKP